MQVTFLGAGAFGSVLGKIVEENGNEVKFYDPIKFPKVKLDEALKDVEAIVYVAPAAAAKRLLPKLPKDVPLICASKGFLSMKPFKDFKNFSALAGAGIADQIEMDNPPYGDKFIFTASSELSERLFTTELIQIEYTKDTLGILLCGALKNVYAIACGLGENDYYAIRDEWASILKANGATDLTKFYCGMPDLLMCVAYGSRNVDFGRCLKDNPGVSGLEIGSTVEGITVVDSLENYPEFKVPENAKIFKETVKKVKHAIK